MIFFLPLFVYNIWLSVDPLLRSVYVPRRCFKSNLLKMPLHGVTASWGPYIGKWGGRERRLMSASWCNLGNKKRESWDGLISVTISQTNISTQVVCLQYLGWSFSNSQGIYHRFQWGLMFQHNWLLYRVCSHNAAGILRYQECPLSVTVCFFKNWASVTLSIIKNRKMHSLPFQGLHAVPVSLLCQECKTFHAASDYLRQSWLFPYLRMFRWAATDVDHLGWCVFACVLTCSLCDTVWCVCAVVDYSEVVKTPLIRLHPPGPVSGRVFRLKWHPVLCIVHYFRPALVKSSTLRYRLPFGMRPSISLPEPQLSAFITLSAKIH